MVWLHCQQIRHHARADEYVSDIVDKEAGAIEAEMEKVGHRSKYSPVNEISYRPAKDFPGQGHSLNYYYAGLAGPWPKRHARKTGSRRVKKR